jgi:hypothetical protein
VSSSKREISSSLKAPCRSLWPMRIPRLIVVVQQARTIVPRRPEEKGAKTRLLIATRRPVGLLASPARGGRFLRACRKDTKGDREIIQPPMYSLVESIDRTYRARGRTVLNGRSRSTSSRP